MQTQVLNDVNNFKDVESLLSGKEYPTVLQLMLKEEGVLAVDYRQDLNHAWYLVGEAYYGLEEFSSALTSFQESFNSDQYDYMALMAQANCLSNMGGTTAAELLLRKAIDITGGTSQLYYNLGNALFDQRRYLDSIAKYEKVSDTYADLYAWAQDNICKAEKLIEQEDDNEN